MDIGGGVSLNGWIMKPPGFDPSRKYPVLFYVYGGPGSQTVMDSWGGSTSLWHAMLTQQGYLVASVDNRGTGARARLPQGHLRPDGRHRDPGPGGGGAGHRALGLRGLHTDGHLGMELRRLATQHLFRANDVYRMGVAVAPVTHWKYYDNIYTERYNGLPQENAAGYERGSPLTYAGQLTGDLLVVHGTGDDNVHYQNTEALQNALVKANKQYTMMSYPNRNHGIFGGNTTRHLRTLLTEYIHEHLRVGAGAHALVGRPLASLRPGSYIDGDPGPEANMKYEEVVSLLGYAGDHDQPVRINLDGATEVVGVPTSLDTHIAAHEVYLRPRPRGRGHGKSPCPSATSAGGTALTR